VNVGTEKARDEGLGQAENAPSDLVQRSWVGLFRVGGAFRGRKGSREERREEGEEGRIVEHVLLTAPKNEPELEGREDRKA
jgi:hypothetical protein